MRLAPGILTRWSGVAALLAFSACLQVAGAVDAGPPSCCTLDCVETTLGCGLFPEGTPDYTCIALVGPSSYVDSGAAIPAYAAQACDAAGEGAKVSCIARRFPGDTCGSILGDAGYAGLQASISAVCPGGFIPGACDDACLACRQTCGQTAVACNAPCLDAGGYYDCLGCNAQCNQEQAVCEAACTKE